MSGNILEVTFRLRDSVNAHSHVANLSFKIFKLGDQFIYVNPSNINQNKITYQILAFRFLNPCNQLNAKKVKSVQL